MVEHLHGMQRVSGSNPLRSTIFRGGPAQGRFFCRGVLIAPHSNPSIIAMLNGQELAIACAEAAEELKAEDVRVFDLRGISSLTDFMVVCSGNSQPHLKAITRDVESLVREKGSEPANATEGKAASRWVVIDFVDVMVHVLDEEFRENYALEKLWGDAKEVEWSVADEN